MKRYSIFLILIVFSVFFGSCKYDFILPEEDPIIEPGGDPISFSTQIAPIFSNGNKCTSCHKTGGTAPDLSAARAYAQIVPKYVNLGSPETSTIYTYVSPATGTHSWKKYTAAEAAIILLWITEGAENN